MKYKFTLQSKELHNGCNGVRDTRYVKKKNIGLTSSYICELCIIFKHSKFTNFFHFTHNLTKTHPIIHIPNIEHTTNTIEINFITFFFFIFLFFFFSYSKYNFFFFFQQFYFKVQKYTQTSNQPML